MAACRLLLPFQLYDLGITGLGLLARIRSSQQSRCNIPLLPGIGDHRNRFAIVSGHDPEQRRMPGGMKSDPFADREVQHLRMRPHLAQKS